MPVFNEEETIGTVVMRALEHVDEVICIDDGSSDASARIAEACGATVIRHRVNRGYGGALKTLFKHARQMDVDALVVLDSDGQHDTNDTPDSSSQSWTARPTSPSISLRRGRRRHPHAGLPPAGHSRHHGHVKPEQRTRDP